MKICITGAAGFIGAHLAAALGDSHEVIGFDNFNSYYSPELKQKRIAALTNNSCGSLRQATNIKCQIIKGDLANKADIKKLFSHAPFDIVIHLAAQAGVRYSIENPQSYIDSNLQGFFNILEACRHHPPQHFIFASSSSVYGNNENLPYKITANTDQPLSLYGATKKANEVMAHAYSHLYNLPTTALRFFTVYGEWGRPDMAYYNFTKKILAGDTIDLYNNGNHKRDFTYIADIIESITRLINHPPKKTNSPPYKLFNIGNSSPVELLHFVETLENIIGKKAKKNFVEMQQGDVHSTHSDTSELEKIIQFKPNTPLEMGLENFVKWYRQYHGNG